MDYINDGFWQKSYLLEFRKNKVLTDAYTFSLPPESEEFQFPQRINETKTYAGVIYDDYGNDTVRISLSGSTGNTKIKRIFRGNTLNEMYLDNKDEIFYLQNLLETYGDKSNLKGKEVWLYPLWSGKTFLELAKKTYSSVRSYRVLINDFSIKRSKDNPLVFKYSINFTSIDKGEKSIYTDNVKTNEDPLTIINKIEEKVSKLQSFKDNVKNGLEAYKDWLGETFNFIEKAQNSVDSFNNEISDWRNLLLGFSDATIEVLSDVNSLISSGVSAGSNLVTSAVSLVKEPVMSVSSVYKAAENVWGSFVDLFNYTNDVFDLTDGNPVIDEIAESFSQTSQDFVDDYHRLSLQSVNDAADLYCEALNLPDSLPVTDNTETGTATATYSTVYRSVEVTVSDGDSLESLATEYFGDASYAEVIASYNSVTGQLTAGTKIYIPELNPLANTGNEIITNQVHHDSYGADISSDNGVINVINGDLGSISGEENLRQAITNRIQTEIDTRVRLLGYGIKQNIGGQALTDYLISSIKDTVESDPRVNSVESVSVNGTGDTVNIVIAYTDINNNKAIYGGQF